MKRWQVISWTSNGPVDAYINSPGLIELIMGQGLLCRTVGSGNRQILIFPQSCPGCVHIYMECPEWICHIGEGRSGQRLMVWKQTWKIRVLDPFLAEQILLPTLSLLHNNDIYMCWSQLSTITHPPQPRACVNEHTFSDLLTQSNGTLTASLSQNGYIEIRTMVLICVNGRSDFAIRILFGL